MDFDKPLETESDKKIAEKETVNKEIEKDIETENKPAKKLLTGYNTYDKKAKKDKFVSYDSLMTLGNNPTATYNLTKDLEIAYHLSYNKDDDKPYLFDYNCNSYIKIDNRKLQEFLATNENIRLRTTDTENLIKSTIKRIQNNYNYIEFDNKLFNLKNNKLEDKTIKKVIENKEYGTNKPRPFITPKRINHDILENKDKNFDPENSIIYKTLKQILGTEDNIKDFKQRLGVSIFNKGKEITIYYGKNGDNGKSGLLYIRRLVLGALASKIRPTTLKDQFNHEIFNNVHEHQFDENKGNTFKDTETDLKDLTGGVSEETNRKMHSQGTQTTRKGSHVVIATNELPDFNLNDTALFKRLSIIELTNQFTEDNTKIDNKTIFPVNFNYKEELAEDKKGIEHLLFESIEEHELRVNNKEIFINKNGVEYARAFYLGNDHLKNFLNLYVEVTEYETETTTATEIYNNYVKYIKDNNINYILDEKQLVKKIGSKLNELYGKSNIIRKTENNQRYLKNIKCVYITGVEKGYTVNTELEDYEILDKYHRKIFNLIEKGYNSFELLKQQEKEHNKILDSINYLKDNGYIQEDYNLKIN